FLNADGYYFSLRYPSDYQAIIRKDGKVFPLIDGKSQLVAIFDFFTSPQAMEQYAFLQGTSSALVRITSMMHRAFTRWIHNMVVIRERLRSAHQPFDFTDCINFGHDPDRELVIKTEEEFRQDLDLLLGQNRIRQHNLFVVMPREAFINSDLVELYRKIFSFLEKGFDTPLLGGVYTREGYVDVRQLLDTKAISYYRENFTPFLCADINCVDTRMLAFFVFFEMVSNLFQARYFDRNARHVGIGVQRFQQGSQAAVEMVFVDDGPGFEEITMAFETRYTSKVFSNPRDCGLGCFLTHALVVLGGRGEIEVLSRGQHVHYRNNKSTKIAQGSLSSITAVVIRIQDQGQIKPLLPLMATTRTVDESSRFAAEEVWPTQTLLCSSWSIVFFFISGFALKDIWMDELLRNTLTGSVTGFLGQLFAGYVAKRRWNVLSALGMGVLGATFGFQIHHGFRIINQFFPYEAYWLTQGMRTFLISGLGLATLLQTSVWGYLARILDRSGRCGRKRATDHYSIRSQIAKNIDSIIFIFSLGVGTNYLSQLWDSPLFYMSSGMLVFIAHRYFDERPTPVMDLLGRARRFFSRRFS
ncbi:MAG TPA: hypothetical protein PLO93_04800, partial [Candidatus Omnitrophota bacterium]|nr:hypothetical protein [Candidatus Omnitrophota bacterium]